MSIYTRVLTCVCVLGIFAGSSFAQKKVTGNAKPAPDSTTVQDNKPKMFDLYFHVKSDKYDTNLVKQVWQSFMARLNSSGLVPTRDYNIYVSKDTITVRFLDNSRVNTDWWSMLVRSGVLQLRLMTDSMYDQKVDTNKVPAHYAVFSEIDGKTKHYVSDKLLNGKLAQLLCTIEKFDQPTLTAVILPKDTQYTSFLFNKGMRLVVLIDNVIYNTMVVNRDSVALSAFPILTQYPSDLTYVLDRVVRFPLETQVDFLGYRPLKEEDLKNSKE